MTGFPKKLIIEPTTRCNLKCEMCVKQSENCFIEEGDLGKSTFKRLGLLLPNLTSLIFTGIGEPLLNSNLCFFISRAKETMPQNSKIGFQTNGKLLTRGLTDELVHAGVNQICISVDSISAEKFNTIRKNGSFADVTNAMECLRQTRGKFPGKSLEIGIEFVLMKNNIDELPDVVQWACEQGADFFMATHVIQYTPMDEQLVYMKNSQVEVMLFKEIVSISRMYGIDLQNYLDVLRRSNKSKQERKGCSLINEKIEQAEAQNIHLNFSKLMEEDAPHSIHLAKIISAVQKVAKKNGIKLMLPEIRPLEERLCPFIEDSTMFVTWDGNVAPCHFLWHRFDIWRSGKPKHIRPIFFGNILKTDPLHLWNLPDYRNFRKSVQKYNYANCLTWCREPCSFVLEDPFDADCMDSNLPCCDCGWNTGFFKCLA